MSSVHNRAIAYMNSQQWWFSSQDLYKIKPANSPTWIEKEPMRDNSWLRSYWQLMATEGGRFCYILWCKSYQVIHESWYPNSCAHNTALIILIGIYMSVYIHMCVCICLCLKLWKDKKFRRNCSSSRVWKLNMIKIHHVQWSNFQWITKNKRIYNDGDDNSGVFYFLAFLWRQEFHVLRLAANMWYR